MFFFLRPTATELLKHPIFKKAKDKKYLQSTLIAIGPSLETRVQKVTFLNYVKYDFLKIFLFVIIIIILFQYKIIFILKS